MPKIFPKISFSSPRWILIILLLLILPAIFPLFKPYISGTADGLGHKFRLVSFYESLSEGNLRPRWNSEAALGYGAPIFLYNYPLPYYLGSLFVKLGYSINRSGQLLSAFSLFFSSIFMFLMVMRLTGSRLGGLVAGITYLYAPYHLQMTYLYDSWGEELAFVFPPLILYLIALSVKREALRRVFFLSAFRFPLSALHPSTALGTSLVLLTIVWVLFILSHNVSVVMFSPLLLILASLMFRSEVQPRLAWLVGMSAFVSAAVMSSFFWLPAYALQNQMKYPHFLAGEGAMRGAFFKSFSFQLDTAMRVMREGTTHYLDFTIGLPILIVGVIGLLHLLFSLFARKQNFLARKVSIFRKSVLQKSFTTIINFFNIHNHGIRFRMRSTKILSCCAKNFELLMLLMLLLFSLYLTNYASEWLWNFPPFTYILYPFRFLFVASFFGAHLSGVVVGRVSSGSYVRRMGGWLLALILIAAALVQGRPYTNPYVEIFPFPESYFKQRQTVTFAPFTRKNMLIKEFLPTRASLQFLATEEKQYLEAYFKGEAIESKDVSISKGEGVIERIKIGVEKVSGALEAKTPVTVLFHRFFFPNWEVFVDGVKYPLSADEVGRIMVEVPAGKHQLQLVFGTTKIEKIANIVSLVGGLIFGLEVAFIISRRVRRVNSIKYQV